MYRKRFDAQRSKLSKKCRDIFVSVRKDLKMKKLLVFCMILAGAFTGYSDSPQESEPVAITGFGGYTLGEMLNPKALNEKMRERGYVDCKAQKPFRKFVNVRLYFTPKTFLIYKIESSSKGGLDEKKILDSALERKYNQKRQTIYGEYAIIVGDRIIKTRLRDDSVIILVIDSKLVKQKDKEKEEIAQEVDISGL